MKDTIQTCDFRHFILVLVVQAHLTIRAPRYHLNEAWFKQSFGQIRR